MWTLPFGKIWPPCSEADKVFKRNCHQSKRITPRLHVSTCQKVKPSRPSAGNVSGTESGGSDFMAC